MDSCLIPGISCRLSPASRFLRLDGGQGLQRAGTMQWRCPARLSIRALACAVELAKDGGRRVIVFTNSRRTAQTRATTTLCVSRRTRKRSPARRFWSQQLARLRLEGLVSARRDGKTIHYIAENEEPRLMRQPFEELARFPRADSRPSHRQQRWRSIAPPFGRAHPERRSGSRG